jgi:5-methylcytosine-specific restriction enzyme subunit McrC
MEYVFEDFIYGFIDRELPSISVRSQRSDTYLDEGKIFNLKPDLWLKTSHRSLIVDTKYKIVYDDLKDTKKGISQSDLYQMLAYAVRFGVKEIILFYPETIKSDQIQESELTLKDTLADGKEILIKIFQLPIIERILLERPFETNINLSKLFEPTRLRLVSRLEEILTIQ